MTKLAWINFAGKRFGYSSHAGFAGSIGNVTLFTPYLFTGEMHMASDRIGSRFVAHSIHWLLILTTLVLLGSGWAVQTLQLTAADKQFWDETHNSLGLTCAILLLLYVASGAIHRPFRAIDGISAWRSRIAATVSIFLCLILAVQIASGYLEIALAGRPISFWGFALPEWDAVNPVSAAPFRDIHQVGAFVTVGLIVLHAALSGLNRIGRRTVTIPEPGPLSSEGKPSPDEQPRLEQERRAEERQQAEIEPPKEDKPDVEGPSETEAHQLAIIEKRTLVVTNTANNLAKNLRLFGWADFWLQFILGLVTGLLLVFASSGKAFSPSKAGFGDAIYWGWSGFMLLIPAIFLALYYTRASKKVTLLPEKYLSHKKRFAFWFLRMGLLIGGSGIFVSFIGVALSIVLLVVKTISQPPGIAITDPHNIIRALDVFVLIVNFMSLIAHFFGVLTALWLGYCASTARVSYMSIRSQAE